MMNETEHLLTVVAEECAEAAQVACKAIRFGLGDVKPGQNDDNLRMLERELGDVLGAARLLGLTIREEDVIAKIEKLKKYMDYARGLGTLVGASGGGSSGAEAVIRDLLKNGEHEGPCDNEEDPYDSCSLHVEAVRKRDQAAREFMGMPPREEK